MNTGNLNQAQGQKIVGAVLGASYDRPKAESVAMAGEACCARESAKGVIRERARRLHREADRLEVLAQSLPEVLPPAADEALWDLVTSARR
jgi:hypothetical protein